MSKKNYKRNGLGRNFLAGVVLSSSFALASFQNIDCDKDSKVLGISPEACSVLEKLWDSTNGKNWYEHENWDTLTKVSGWDGVRVAQGEVSELLFYSNNLKGAIPSEIVHLSELKKLALDNNKLSGKIPDSLELLSNLTYLSLNNNSLSGKLPLSLGSVSNLKELYLNNNQLEGEIPNSLGELTKLMVLKVYNNKLSGAIPMTIGNLSSLESLSLSENRLTGTIPESLGLLSKLTYLDLKNNQLSGSIPFSLGNLSSLSGLYLQHNQLDGAIPSSIGSLFTLSDLDLAENHLSGEIPSSLDNLENLTYLSVANNQLSGTLSKSLVSLPRLSYFNIEKNLYTEKDIAPILSELKYMPSYHLDRQLTLEEKKRVEFNSEEKSLESNNGDNEYSNNQETLNDSVAMPTVIHVLKSEEMAFFDVDTIKILGTENFGDSLSVKNEGNWTIGEDGKIIFTPLDTLLKNPTDISYTIENSSGMLSEPISVSIHYEFPLENNRTTVVLFNLSNEKRINFESVEILLSGALEEHLVESELSEDKKELRVEGEGVWRIEKNAELTFTPIEGFNGKPTQISYLLKGESQVTIGTVNVKEKNDSNSIATFNGYGLFLMMFLSGLLGVFYMRKINQQEIIK